MPVIAPDPVWTGVGNRYAWTGTYKPYRLHYLNGALGVDGDDAILDVQPFPAEYKEAPVVATSGTGRYMRAGWSTALWNFQQLTAGQGKQILDIYHTAKAQYDGWVYIVTATNNTTLVTDPTSGWQELRFTYTKFYANMGEPTYEQGSNYTFRQFKVPFQHLRAA